MRSIEKPTIYPKFRGELRPFDLRRALAGAPVVTRLGYEVTGVRQIGHQVHGVVNGEIAEWQLTGCFPNPNPKARILDLCIGIREKETWVTRWADRLEGFFLGSRRTA